MGKVYMCGSFKGGVGKTVTTFNLAYSFAAMTMSSKVCKSFYSTSDFSLAL